MKYLVKLSLIMTLLVSAFSSKSQTVTVTANHGDTICAGTNMFFHATTTDTSLRFRWIRNSTIVGGIGPNYGNNALVTGDTVFCYLTNAAGDTVLDTSNLHIMTVNASVHPSIITGGDSVCVGGTLALFDSVAGGVWHSTNTSVFTVDSLTGVVTGVAPGFGATRVVYTITTGNCPDSVRLRIRVNVPAGPLMGPSIVCRDSMFRIRDTARGGVFTVSDATIADIVFPNGGFQAYQAGTVSIYYAVSNACGSFLDTMIVSIVNCDSATGVSNTAVTATGLNIFPNPNNGSFSVKFETAENSTAVLSITDMMGRAIEKMDIAANKDYTITSGFAPGIYFITLKTGTKTYTQKVLVN
ncbi:hypothetical protein CJD36_003350 [Flavipsychrobacter stenotrophus]|uniref:Secretion system C-terminal sorting domain-containing protein n=1 Tax=Flavipsychrobacter stenotrophus TaxID=2077091 RepID=A0A2S7T219_9BACT|nr:T9SS type A sorting domain-containing protein [Flavipsychrobacter stenotrophus]PQJ12796.1 hypothetical protein CJD36_003350 [Flavipsychrobacter stenotrophus]